MHPTMAALSHFPNVACMSRDALAANPAIFKPYPIQTKRQLSNRQARNASLESSTATGKRKKQ